MHITCSTDDRFVSHCYIMLLSLFENNKRENITIHILYISLSEMNRKLLSDLIVDSGSIAHFYAINAQMWKGLPSSDSISMSAYNRLLIPQLLPANLERVIYLDCDIIIVGALTELWDESLDGFSVAAVEDVYSLKKETFVRLNYDMSYKYFNSGVILFNLSFFRNKYLCDRILDIISSLKGHILLHDQDILNVLCYDTKKLISNRWNYLETFCEKEEQPIIIHFAGPVKPWFWGCRNEFTYLYTKYRLESPWRDDVPTFIKSCKSLKIFFYIAYLLHLEKVYFKIANFVKRLV